MSFGIYDWLNDPQRNQKIIGSRLNDEFAGKINPFARMFPASNQGSGPWIVVGPQGGAINTIGTTTQGFQELLTAANTNNWNIWVSGRGTITCTTQITVPINGNRTFLVDAGISFSFGALGSSDLMVFDSHENADVRFYGQIVQHGGDTGACVSLNGTTNSPFGNKGFLASYLEFASIGPASGGIGIRMDCTTGGMIGNRIVTRDINGGAIGVKVVNPGTAFIVFEHNQLQNFYSHSQSTSFLQIGQSSTNQAGMRQNLWSLGRIDPANGSASAVDTWGSNDTFLAPFMPNEGASVTDGIKIRGGADGNVVVGGILSGTTPLNDGGTNTATIGVSGVANRIPTQGIGTPAVSTSFLQLAAGSTAKSSLNVPSGVAPSSPQDGDFWYDGSAVNVRIGSASKKLAVLSDVGLISFKTTAVNFNSANSDTAVAISLPTGFSRYVVNTVFIDHASASLTAATVGLFTASGGGGTALFTGQAVTVSTASDNTNNNCQQISGSTTLSLTAATLNFRVQNPQGSAATGDVTIFIRPLP